MVVIDEFSMLKLDMLYQLDLQLNPKKGRDGSVYNTPLQMELNLKIGAQVMLTHNVDVLDSLTNGTIGKVV